MTEQDYREWLDSPITKEFHNDLKGGLEVQGRMALTKPPPGQTLEEYIGFCRGYAECTEAHLVWKPEALTEEEDQDEE